MSRTVFAATGGKGASPIYLVFARAPKGTGEVRVALNAKTGAVLNVMHRDWAGTAPDWWVKGEEDPVGTTSPRR